MLPLLHSLMIAAGSALRARLAPEVQLDAPERLAWERALIAAHASGDRAAFDALYRAYAGALYARVLLPILKQPMLAEDALADTFARAHETLAHFEATDRSVYFWLARIAKNRALDLQRHAAVRRMAAAELRTHFQRLQLPDPDPETALTLRGETTYASARVARILAALPPRYRRAIELRFYEERSREECAQSLAVKLGTFDVLLLRALRAFRQQWEKEPA